MKRTYILLTLFISLFFISLNTDVSSDIEIMETSVLPNSTESHSFEFPNLMTYTPHDPIIITNDTQLEVFPGNGTEVDPFVIENFSINASLDESEYHCILIFDITKHVVIKNCYLITENKGITVERTAPNTMEIYNNTCIFNSTSHFDGFGIIAHFSNYVNISENFCYHFEEGINVIYSEYANVNGNRLNLNELGMRVDFSPNSTVDNNSITHVDEQISAILIYDSHNSTFSRNNITTGGFYIYGVQENMTFEQNFITGKLFGYFFKEENLVLPELEYGQLYLYECQNINITNQFVFSTSRGITLRDCINVSVENCLFSYHGQGLHIFRGYQNLVSNNIFLDNYIGLYSYSALQTDIYNNTFEDNEAFGVYLFYCEMNSIYHNSFINNNIGNPMFFDELGAVQSQAFDQPKFGILSGSEDKWYDEVTKLGNFWNEYSFSCSDDDIGYSIAGDPISTPTYYEDPYPLFEDLTGCYVPEPSTSETVFLVGFLVSVFPVIAIVLKRIRRNRN